MAPVNLIGSYNYALVALSVLIAMFASYAALDLAGRVTAPGGWTLAGWLRGDSGVGHCAVRGEPPENGCVPSGRRKCPDGCGYCEYALHRHGRHAFSGYVPVQFLCGCPVRRVRGSDFSCRALDYLSPPR